jgi:hypothetical protein
VLRRFDDWPARLSSFLEARRDTPFRYGAHDCCLFTADAVLAMTGTDVAVSFRDHYRSAFGALRRLRIATPIATVEGVADQVFGCGVTPNYAQRGDVVLLASPSGLILGIVALDGRAAAAAETGWLAFPLSCARRAWRI